MASGGSKGPCPCGSGEAYGACCGPLHAGQREAADATALMRSRYAAYARKEVAYVWRTLHPDHEDRARPEEQVLRELRDACAVNRYLGLRILGATGPDDAGIATVTFAVRVFRKGVDLSFSERSEFKRDGEGWRYLRGEIVS